MEVLQGTIERVVFENVDNGYVIARLNSESLPGELITVVGNLASINPGESLLLKGLWVNNPKYGRQFKIEQYETVLPSTIIGLRKYLGSGLIKGVGPVMANRIVDKFGPDTLEIIENQPEKLSQVEGVGKKRIGIIKSAWSAQREIKNVMIFLQSHNVSTTHATKIYKTYQDQAIPVVKENPYRLADDIYGIGFKTADSIAQNLGVDNESPYRVQAGLKYVLSQKAEEGHVFLFRTELISTCQEILELSESAISEGISALIAAEDIISETIREEEAIFLAPFYYAEVGIANIIGRMLQFPPASLSQADFDRSIDQIQHSLAIHLANGQKKAIQTAVNSQVMVLTGGPGTGKTTTTLGMIRLLEKLGYRILLAAPTGRAAKRLSEATGREAKTVHRLLEFSPNEGGFQRNRHNPLEADVVIVDEVSMIDLVLMNNLVKAVSQKTKLILIGDVDQLPSVGAGNVLKDMIASEVVDLVRLTEVFRQAQESMIITNAHQINSGQGPNLTGDASRDFFFIEVDDVDQVAEQIGQLVQSRLPKHYGFDPFNDVQVLCPMRRGVVGSENLNKLLQKLLNPPNSGMINSGSMFRVGDKVMQVRNNYEYDVFNGDIGRVEAVDQIDKVLQIRFPDKIVDYDMADLNELVLAYATTVHKSQGSEYQAVILPLVTQHYIMLQRNLLYTGITRAKKIVVLIGSKRALNICVHNNKVTHRNTHLSARLQDRIIATTNGRNRPDSADYSLSGL